MELAISAFERLVGELWVIRGMLGDELFSLLRGPSHVCDRNHSPHASGLVVKHSHCIHRWCWQLNADPASTVFVEPHIFWQVRRVGDRAALHR